MGALVIVAMAALFGAEKYSDYLGNMSKSAKGTAEQHGRNVKAKSGLKGFRGHFCNNTR